MILPPPVPAGHSRRDCDAAGRSSMQKKRAMATTGGAQHAFTRPPGSNAPVAEQPAVGCWGSAARSQPSTSTAAAAAPRDTVPVCSSTAGEDCPLEDFRRFFRGGIGVLLGTGSSMGDQWALASLEKGRAHAPRVPRPTASGRTRRLRPRPSKQAACRRGLLLAKFAARARAGKQYAEEQVLRVDLTCRRLRPMCFFTQNQKESRTLDL